MTRGALYVRHAWLLGVLIPVVLATSAHVGTSNAYFEGPAGPYRIRVIVRTPGVIPGLAQISVRVTSGEGVEQITVRPLRWDVGLEGAPPPDIAQPVAGEPDLYSAELWLMTTSSYSVHVEVSGTDGEGTAFVPVMAVAEQRLEMHPAMAVGLVGAAGFLFIGAITVFGAAVRESVLEPGRIPDATRRLRARIAMVVGALVLGVIAWGGWTWWDDVDAAYMSRIYRPLSTSSAISTRDDGPVLQLTIDDPSWGGRDWSPLMADHGKLMHMFLVRDDDLSAFAHIHPTSSDPAESASFEVPVPPLPAGDYRIYADIVHESGFAQTLVDTVGLPAGLTPRETDARTTTDAGSAAPVDADNVTDLDANQRDPDDSWAELLPVGASAADEYMLPSGRTVRWEARGASLADEETTLRFAVAEADGTPAELEMYMGMLSHAAVSRDDGSVFVHLHPSGSINMAAQMRFEREEGSGDAGAMMAMRGVHDMATTNVVAFPFVFPAPGPYRIFVQIKVSGEVETAVFDLDVS